METPEDTLSKNQKPLSIENSASVLLNRPPLEEYTDEWTDALMRKADTQSKVGTLSVVVFRLGTEWLALPTIFFNQVIHHRTIHTIPHRKDNVLTGVVSLEGELQICIALHKLLEIEADSITKKNQNYTRMIAIEKNEDLWVFPVDEIDGIYLWDLSLLENIPVNVSKSTASYLKGIMNVGNRNMGLLDEELLFYSLKKGVL